MDVRQRTEEIEHLTFAPWATFSDASRGRAVPEPQDPLRPVFQRDRDRVLHCKAFRRLKQKTQVFLSPEGDTELPPSTGPLCYNCRRRGAWDRLRRDFRWKGGRRTRKGREPAWMCAREPKRSNT